MPADVSALKLTQKQKSTSTQSQNQQDEAASLRKTLLGELTDALQIQRHAVVNNSLGLPEMAAETYRDLYSIISSFHAELAENEKVDQRLLTVVQKGWNGELLFQGDMCGALKDVLKFDAQNQVIDRRNNSLVYKYSKTLHVIERELAERVDTLSIANGYLCNYEDKYDEYNEQGQGGRTVIVLQHWKNLQYDVKTTTGRIETRVVPRDCLSNCKPNTGENSVEERSTEIAERRIQVETESFADYLREILTSHDAIVTRFESSDAIHTRFKLWWAQEMANSEYLHGPKERFDEAYDICWYFLSKLDATYSLESPQGQLDRDDIVRKFEDIFYIDSPIYEPDYKSGFSSIHDVLSNPGLMVNKPDFKIAPSSNKALKNLLIHEELIGADQPVPKTDARMVENMINRLQINPRGGIYQVLSTLKRVQS
jgi:hypothetical protein